MKTKIKKGYYLVSFIFALTTILTLSYLQDSNYEIMVEIDTYHVYVSATTIYLFQSLIYVIAILGLMKNKIWGLLLSTTVSLGLFIRYLHVSNFHPFYFIIPIIYVTIFFYLMAVIVEKIKRVIE